jgi:hypothetical protein
MWKSNTHGNSHAMEAMFIKGFVLRNLSKDTKMYSSFRLLSEVVLKVKQN